MSSTEFSEWIAYDRISMPEPLRSDYRTASIVQAIYAVNTGKGRTPPELEECKLDFDLTKSALPTTEELMEKLKREFKRLGIKRKK